MNITDICRVCLCGDRRMYAMSDTVLQETWERLTNAMFDTNDWKPLLVCYLCGAQLRNSHQLMKRAQKAEELLTVFINDGLKESERTVSLINILTKEYDYKYAIENLYILECKQNKIKIENEARSEKDNVITIREEEGGRNCIVNETEKENVGVSERDNEEENDINIKEEEEVDNTVEETEKENIGVSERDYEEENGINIIEEEEDNTVEETEKVGGSKRNNEEEKDINVKEEEVDNTVEETEKENVQVNERDKEVESDNINIKEEEEDCPDSDQEEDVDVADVECSTNSDVDAPLASTILKSILKREVRIVLEKIDISSATRKRKLIKAPLKAKQIKLNETSEDGNSLLINAVSKSLPNNHHKVSDISYSNNLSVASNVKIAKSKQTTESIVDKNSPEINILPKRKIQSKNVIEKNKKKLTSKVYSNDVECDNSKKCFSKTADAFAPSTSLHRSDEGNEANSCNKKRTERKFSCHKCQFKCVSKSYLNVHLRKHTREKPYKCDDEFSVIINELSDMLKSHMKQKRTKKKKFTCHVCECKFATNRELKQHLRKHTGEKP